MRPARPEPPSAPTPPRRRNRADALCILALLAVTVGVYAPALFGGRVLLPADIVPLMRPWAATAAERFPDFRFAQNQMHGPIFEYYSWRHYARERLRRGEVPLWNPYELGGNVLLANSQSAVLYPPNLLLYLFPLWYGVNLVTALHTFLTGLFMYGLLRALALRPVAALAGALAWMLGGVMTVWTEFQTPTAALCWLPGALWAWERYAQGAGWRWGIFGAGGALAMTLLAGHLHFAFYVFLAFALYALWRIVSPRRQEGHEEDSGFGMQDFGSERAASPLPSILALAGALAFALLLSAATMLPVVEMARMNFRAAKPGYASSVALALPPEQLFMLLQPDLFGNPRDYVVLDAQGSAGPGHAYWGKYDYIEYTAYPGIPALLLALLAIGEGFRRASRKGAKAPEEDSGFGRQDSGAGAQTHGSVPQPSTLNLHPSPFPPSAFFVLLALLGLLLALGTPVCALFYYGVPGYRQFNATARALCLFSFATAALAAFGAQALAEAAESGTGGRTRRIAGWVVGLTVAAGLVGFPGLAPFWTMPTPDGRQIARLLTDEWLPYAMAGLARFLAFALLTGLAMWLVLGSRKSQVANRTPEEPHARAQRRRGKKDSGFWSQDSGSGRAASPLLWLLPVLVAADLMIWGWGFNPMTDPRMLGYPTETTKFLRTAAPHRVVSLETPGRGIKSFIVPNYNAVAGLREAQGADSLHTRRYHQMMARVVKAMEPERAAPFDDPNTVRVHGVRHPLFDLLNVRYVTTESERPAPAAGYRRVKEAELTVWENPGALGRAWVAGAAERIRGVEDAFARLSAPGFDPRRTALLEGEPPPLDAGAAGSPAALTAFAPHRLAAEVDARGHGLLVLPETAFPGWRAAVDGRPAPVLTADYLLRAVPVPPGRHRVTLAYQPASYRLGLYLTALAGGVFLAAWACRNGRRKPQ